MRVVVTGASGTIGGALAGALRDRGDTVIGISRSPAGAGGDIEWRSWDDLPAAVAGADAVVHLAGAGVADKRWSAARKRELRDSRIDTARRIVAVIGAAAEKPGRASSAGSAVGVYGSRGDELLSEASAPGDDFLARLCVDWEAAAQGAGVRTVTLRTGVVLAREGGALAKLLPPFKLGAGGPIGRGRQYMPWIHRDDIVGLILHAIDTPTLEGPLNGVAPEPVRNAAFGKALGAALRRPALMPTPPIALRLLLGERAGVLTASQRVSAARAQASGYAFRHPAIDGALRDLVG